ncbi:unnamed protein product, partial [Mesorhabditis spiculigera]
MLGVVLFISMAFPGGGQAQNGTETTTIAPIKDTFTVGMIVTESLQAQIGFSITGGVIPIALQQIAKLHLLDAINFEFVVNYTDCSEANAAGIAVYLINERKVDVILGPPCAAVIAVCMPDDQSRRNFLISTSEAGMNGTDYVYIMMDLRGFGFGQLGKVAGGETLDSGYTPVWVDTFNAKPDGLDAVAKQAALQAIVIDLTNQGTVDGQTTADLTPSVSFSGTTCPLTTWEQSGTYILVGVGIVVALMIVFAILICYIAKEKRKERARQDAEWQIPYLALDRPNGRHSRAAGEGGQQNLMDHVFGLMESYAETLEKEVEDRMSELVEEKKKSDILLYRMLPRQVADKLKLGQSVEPESFDSVTIFFSDVVQFTNLAAKCTPLQIVNLLNDLYTTFDQIIEQHSVYKVETIGDGYLCVSGLPHRNGNLHVKEICEMSLDFLRAVQGKGVMETFWLLGRAGGAGPMAPLGGAMNTVVAEEEIEQVFRNREPTPPMQNATRLGSAESRHSDTLPGYHTSVGMYRDMQTPR